SPAEEAQTRQALIETLRVGGVTVEAEPLARLQALIDERWAPRARWRFFAEAHQKMAEGRRALERVELRSAEAAFAAAEAMYGVELGSPGVAALHSRAALQHGIALFELGDLVGAAKAFRRARALDAEAILNETMVRPNVVSAFRAALAAPQGSSTLTV